MKKLARIDYWRELTGWRKWLLYMVVALLVYTALGFLFVPPMVSSIMQEKLRLALGRQVSIGALRVNPYLLTVEVDDFAVKARREDAVFVGFDRLVVDVEWLSLFKLGLVCRQLSLLHPQISVVRYEDGSFSFSDLLPAEKADKNDNAKSGDLFFSLAGVTVSGGSVSFDDRQKGAQHTARKMSFVLPLLSSFTKDREDFVQPSFSALLNGSPISLGGASQLFTEVHQSDFSFHLEGMSLPEYRPYLPADRPFDPVSGTVMADVKFTFAGRPGADPVIGLRADLAVANLAIAGSQDQTTYLAAENVSVSVQADDLLTKRVRLSAVAIDKPRLTVVRRADATILPFSLVSSGKAGEASAQPAAEEAPASPPFVLLVDEVTLAGGRIDFADQLVAAGFASTVRDLAISLKHFSTEPETATEYRLSFRTDAAETAAVAGTFVRDPLAVTARVDLAGLDLAGFDPYLRSVLVPKIAAGRLDVGAEVQYAGGAAAALPTADNVTLGLRELQLAAADGVELIAIQELTLAGGRIDPAAHEVVLSRLVGKGGRVLLERNQAGTFNLAGLLQAAGKGDLKESAVSSEQGILETDDTGVIQGETPAATPGEGGSGWQVTLAETEFSDWQVQWRDQQIESGADLVIDRISLQAANVSTRADQAGTVAFSCRPGGTGSIDFSGKVTVTPPKVDLAVRLDSVSLPMVQPYITEAVALSLDDGTISLAGDLAFFLEEGQPRFSFDGDAGLQSLAATDPVTGDPVFGFDAFRFGQLALTGQPAPSLTVKDVALEGFTGRVMVRADGSLNLAALRKKGAESDGEAAAASENLPSESQAASSISVEAVRIVNGAVDFVDASITPNFAASLSEFNGSISGLSSLARDKAQVELAGRVNQQGKFAVQGAVNPLAETLFADLGITVTGMDLPPLSPYAGKYIGKLIDKGKLFLDLHYAIDGSTLKAANRARLDQFTLGKKVESPDATSMPVGLAIALLKNRKGEISLEVPVKGDLANPEFSVGGVIVQVIVNLIAKAATSPFALLGALLPAGVDLSQIAFPPGRSDLPPESVENLGSLAKALYERPGLKVDISGRADADSDAMALRRQGLDRMVQQLRRKELTVAAKGKAAEPDVRVASPEEYLRYLKSAASNAGVLAGKKDREIEALTVPQVEELLLPTIAVSDSDLRLLAGRRGEIIRDHLVATGPVEPERIFVLEPGIGAASEIAIK